MRLALFLSPHFLSSLNCVTRAHTWASETCTGSAAAPLWHDPGPRRCPRTRWKDFISKRFFFLFFLFIYFFLVSWARGSPTTHEFVSTRSQACTVAFFFVSLFLVFCFFFFSSDENSSPWLFGLARYVIEHIAELPAVVMYLRCYTSQRGISRSTKTVSLGPRRHSYLDTGL